MVDDELNPISTGVKYVNGELVPAYSLRNHFAQLSETPFTVIFTIESVVRIVAMGFMFGKGSYLKDTWNLLDFAVVVSRFVLVYFFLGVKLLVAYSQFVLMWTALLQHCLQSLTYQRFEQSECFDHCDL